MPRTIRSWAGAVGAEHARKVIKVMDLAAKTAHRVVALFDSMGVRLKEGVDAVNAYASISAKTAQLSGVVPQIAVVLGSAPPRPAMVAVQNDLVIVGESGRMFMNGPQVVSANTPDKVDAKSLGGAQACLKNAWPSWPAAPTRKPSPWPAPWCACCPPTTWRTRRWT